MVAKIMNVCNVVCNLCGSRNYGEIKKGVYGNAAQNIYKCGACGHFFLGPLLDDAEEERFYIEDYPAFLLKRGDFKNTTPEDHFIKNEKEARRRFGLIKYLLAKGQSVLEIGSASGFFLSKIKPRVEEVFGIEPNTAYREYANKKGIPTCPDIKELGHRKFDIIFLYYVLEHIKDPNGFLKHVKHFLKSSKSRIVIEVPNVDEALVSLYHSPAYNEFVWQRAHCSYFSALTMEKLFKRSGLKAKFIPEQRYDISNHIYWLAECKPGGAGKYAHIFSGALNRKYADDLKDKWLCDTILAVAQPTR